MMRPVKSSSPSAVPPHPPRTFSIGWFRFQCTRRRLGDAIVDCCSFMVEGIVYIMGPVLITLALSIVSLLVYTYFYILVPMMQKKYANDPLYRNVILAVNTVWVVFLVFNVLFNYYCCVRQKHDGPQYDAVVRELAEISNNFDYPETPEEVAACRRDFQDRMVLRMQRRQARSSNTEVESGGADSTSTVTKRRSNNNNPSSPGAKAASAKKPQKVRNWMLMGPYEWGFCGTTNQPKPPRSHYDHVSKLLVLNLDHYCPWMFNAIGYFNYRYFVNFLIYIFIGMAYGVALMFEPVMLSKSPDYRQQILLQRRAIKENSNIFVKENMFVAPRLSPMMPLREEKMTLTLSFMLCLAVGVAILGLGGFHIYLLCSGQTTIEFHANWAARRRARANGQKWKNPYSRGSWRSNWQQVYGTQHRWLLLSLLPSRRDPEFLPVPIPGHSGRREQLVGTRDNDEKANLLSSEEGVSAEQTRRVIEIV